MLGIFDGVLFKPASPETYLRDWSSKLSLSLVSKYKFRFTERVKIANSGIFGEVCFQQISVDISVDLT
jgi:hypothetical protein